MANGRILPDSAPAVTTTILAVCIGLGLWSGLGTNLYPIRPLFLTEYFRDTGLEAALGGQYWRFLTPILLHFGIPHIVFNLLWLWMLGAPFERRLGAGELITFIVAVGTLSNLAQYFYSPGIPFGGMSGVVYGLLGYFWMQGRYNPRFGMRLNRATVVMMLVWFAICWLGIIGDIANMAHTAGLLLGAAWGFASSRLDHP